MRHAESLGRASTEDGALLEWASAGSGEPVVLIAGQAVTRRSWDDLVPRLAALFRVITFDQRGIGESTEGDEPPRTTREFAGDVLAVLGSAGVAKAHVIGHSMGGRVAQWLAIDEPDVVGSLVLIAATGGNERGAPRSPEATRDLADWDAARLAPRFFTDAYLAAHPSAMDLFVRMEGSPRARRRAFDASAAHDAWDQLSSVRSPTLVVHGTDDSITPVENGRALAQAIPGAQYLEIPGGRHALHLDDPRAIDAIVGHMLRHPLPPAG
ncbi:alpha/beta fold hydrolase [Microbacterium deminutum]|uniref:Alpha/beta hydrolase n=1 Tax=Microbacterium deminutum TaxID=344164 RepID=A0ABP5CDM2_9MICO